MSRPNKKGTSKRTTSTAGKKDTKRQKRGVNTEEGEDVNITGDSSHQEPSPHSIDIMQEALRNDLILQEIFSHLGPQDLRSCCEVNEMWWSIADSKILLYELDWLNYGEMKIKLTTGYTNPLIDQKTSVLTAEKEWLENHRERHPFIDLKIIRRATQQEQMEEHRFLKRFGHLVFKLNYNYFVNNRYMSWQTRMAPEAFLKYLTENFPNLEELHLSDLQLEKSFTKPKEIPALNALTHLRKIDFGHATSIGAQRLLSVMLEVMPNVAEIENFPFTNMKLLEASGKVGALRSVRFNGGRSTDADDNTMNNLVEMGLKFRSITIGKRMRTKMNLDFIQRNKAQFEALLELGKDTLEQVTLPPLASIGYLNFPDSMYAMTCLRFRGKLAFEEKYSYFRNGFDLLQKFPKLNKISVEFNNVVLANERQLKCAFPADIFGPEKLGTAIKNLGITSDLQMASKANLVRIFPHVENIETFKHDLTAIPRGIQVYYY